MIITEDIIIRNGFSMSSSPTGRRFFYKEYESMDLIGEEYYPTVHSMLLTKKYGKWELFFDNEQMFITNTVQLKNICEWFDETVNLDKGFIYILKSALGYKIGKTHKIKDRFNFFKITLPFDWNIESLYMVENYHLVEKQLHNFFKELGVKIAGEWFDLDEVMLKQLDIFFKKKFNEHNIIDSQIQTKYLCKNTEYGS